MAWREPGEEQEARRFQIAVEILTVEEIGRSMRWLKWAVLAMSVAALMVWCGLLSVFSAVVAGAVIGLPLWRGIYLHSIYMQRIAKLKSEMELDDKDYDTAEIDDDDDE